MTKEEFICRLAEGEGQRITQRHAGRCYKEFADLHGSSCEEKLRHAQELGILNVRRYASPGVNTAYLHPGDPLTARELAILSVCFLDRERVVAGLRRRHFHWSEERLTTFEKGALVFALANGLLDDEQLKKAGEPVCEERALTSLNRLCILRQKPEIQVVPPREASAAGPGSALHLDFQRLSSAQTQTS